MNPLDKEQAAYLAGVSIRHLERMVNGGQAPSRDADGSFPMEPFREWLKERLSSGNGADQRLTAARAEKAEMEVAEMRRSLVPVSEVKRYWQQLVMSMRARLITIPPTLAPIVAGLAAPEAQAELQRAINEALTEIAGDGVPTGSGAGNPEDLPPAA